MSDLSDNEFFNNADDNVGDDIIEDVNLDDQVTRIRKRRKGAKYVFLERFEKATDAVAWKKNGKRV